MQAFIVPKMHFSDSEDENENVNNPNNELQFIAQELASAPVILEKSQVPQLKRRKDESIATLTKKYQRIFGKPIDTRTLLKKVNNMKTRLKRKTDMKRTGNKAIKLCDWEKIMFKAMEGNTNPTIGTIRGAMHIGIQEGESSLETRNQPTLQRDASEAVHDQASSSEIARPQPSEVTHERPCRTRSDVTMLPKKRKLATEKYETDETRELSTKELQRFVLLQQYKTSVVQQQYYEMKLEHMQRRELSEAQIASDGTKTYRML